MTRTLIWDIETSPNLAYVWGKYQQDVIQFQSEWHMLSVAWKWKGERKIHVRGLDDFELYKTDPENDYELAALAHALFDEADIVVAHNGMNFDTKKAQARMLFHGFDPPSPYREVDTLKIAKAKFAFTSNRLGELCQHLGIGGKLETGGFKTWLGCLRGDPDAWATMKRYNKHDVRILENLYEKLLPWTTTHPNVATIDGVANECPRCGSTAGMMARGNRGNAVSLRKFYQCKGCGGYVMGRKLEILPTKYVV